MNAKLNYDDAMSYYLNMEVNKNCYNCGGRR